MPDNEGKLTIDEKQKAEKWLNARAPNLKCPSCGNKSFAIADHLIAPPIFYGGSVIMGGPTYPMFVLICTHCSHAMSYSAVSANILDSAGRTI